MNLNERLEARGYKLIREEVGPDDYDEDWFCLTCNSEEYTLEGSDGEPTCTRCEPD